MRGIVGMASHFTQPHWALLSHLRLACTLVMQGRWEQFVGLVGICCSTFIAMSRGSTHRSEFLPEGCPISVSVYRANKGLVRRGQFGMNQLDLREHFKIRDVGI